MPRAVHLPMATSSWVPRPHTPEQAWPRYEDVVDVELRWSHQNWLSQAQGGTQRTQHSEPTGEVDDLRGQTSAVGDTLHPSPGSKAREAAQDSPRTASELLDGSRLDSWRASQSWKRSMQVGDQLRSQQSRPPAALPDVVNEVQLSENYPGALKDAAAESADRHHSSDAANASSSWPAQEDYVDYEVDDGLLTSNSQKRRREDVLQAAAVGPCSNTWTVPALKPRRKKKAKDDQAAAKSVPRVINPTAPKPRGRLVGQDREETALTRQIKACVRCRMQKNRCEPDPEDLCRPCLRCQRLAEPALAVLPCLRYIITDASLYREQEAPYQMFSQRWQTMDILDIDEWASDEIRTIEVSHLFHYAPYRAKMRKFVPVEGDMITEVWTDRQGNVRTHDIPPYAIANMKEHVDVVRQFIDRNVSEYIVAVVDKLDPLLWNTYMQAFRHIGNAKEERERLLMGNAFRLWAACRSTSNECRIAGTDTLDVPIVTDPSSPWYLHIPPPPILVAQEECIYYTKLLRPLSKKVLDELQNLMLGNKKKHWFTIYLVTFILLHSCSMITRRDAECAAKWSLPCEYANPHAIAGHHMGALTLLAHFHYSCKGKRPFNMALTEKGLAEVVKACELDTDEEVFVRESAQLVKQRQRMMKRVRDGQLFGHDLFWISQLYDTDWEPSARYV